MDKNLIKSKQAAVTEKVKRLIFDIPKYELAKILEVSRVTFDKKLQNHDWSYAEKLIIDQLSAKYNI